jgi:serine O-acetyltransferase
MRALKAQSSGTDRVTLGNILLIAKSDVSFILEQSGRTAGREWPIRWLASRSARAAMTMRLCGQTTGAVHLLWKEVLGVFFSCDVGSGASLGVPLYIPHPLGIVIGSGTRVRDRVALFQHVTLGRGRDQSYPTVSSGCTIYTGSSIIGAVVLPPGTRIRAHQLVLEHTSVEST